jgi:hypothetical protein
MPGPIDDLMETADWGALARDEAERPLDRRRRDPTPAAEERERRERKARADRRISRLGNLRENETLDEAAEGLGIDPDLAEEAYDQVVNGRPMRPDPTRPWGGMRSHARVRHLPPHSASGARVTAAAAGAESSLQPDGRAAAAAGRSERE